MRKITFNDFLGAINLWYNANGPRVALMWPLKGGWEKWLQAEMAAYINANSQDVFILREWSVYNNNRQQADWVINRTGEEVNGDPNYNSADTIVVELKCQSFNNFKNFVDDVFADEDKLKKTNLNAAFNNAQRVVLGFGFQADLKSTFEDKQYGYTTMGAQQEVFLTWKFVTD